MNASLNYSPLKKTTPILTKTHQLISLNLLFPQTRASDEEEIFEEKCVQFLGKLWQEDYNLLSTIHIIIPIHISPSYDARTASLSLSLSQMSVPQISATMQEIWKLALKESLVFSSVAWSRQQSICLVQFPPMCRNCKKLGKRWSLISLLMGVCQRGL